MSHFLWAPCSFIVLNLNLTFYIFSFWRKLQATICTDYKVSWVGSPTAVYYKSPSHYHLPLELFWNGSLSFFFFCVHFGCSIGGRIYYNMDHLYFCIYLFITRPQPQVFFFPFHLSLPVGCTVCSHALCINILEINRSVLYFLYRWILIIKTFTRLLNKFSLIRKQKKLFCGFVWKVFLGKNK